jgi:hypothetical protein
MCRELELVAREWHPEMMIQFNSGIADLQVCFIAAIHFLAGVAQLPWVKPATVP